MTSKRKGARADYFYYVPITTRWSDNDIYGHVNNVVYYSYFDTTANNFLIHEAGLDIHQDGVVGFVVNSGCDYYAPIAYPDELEGGLRINKLGNRSVEYGIAVFKKGKDTPVAEGHFVHVFVDQSSNDAVEIPTKIKSAFEALMDR